jgi:hypothetical protein
MRGPCVIRPRARAVRLNFKLFDEMRLAHARTEQLETLNRYRLVSGTEPRHPEGIAASATEAREDDEDCDASG